MVKVEIPRQWIMDSRWNFPIQHEFMMNDYFPRIILNKKTMYENFLLWCLIDNFLFIPPRALNGESQKESILGFFSEQWILNVIRTIKYLYTFPPIVDYQIIPLSCENSFGNLCYIFRKRCLRSRNSCCQLVHLYTLLENCNRDCRHWTQFVEYHKTALRHNRSCKYFPRAQLRDHYMHGPPRLQQPPQEYIRSFCRLLYKDFKIRKS